LDIQTAQQEVQATFLRGSVGQAVSGSIWLISSVLATWVGVRPAILVLVLGGVLIFPLTQATLRLMGRPGGLPRGHQMNQLAMEVAFIVPLSLPVIGAASLHNINWFYPAFMVILGVHYMPFIFLYGMWEFGVLSATLLGGGVAIAFLLPNVLSAGGWFTAVVLLLFALVVQLKTGLPSDRRHRSSSVG
jgi:hypothetical protein